MRIISGIYKSRKFSGKIPDIIRPTTDNVREAVFNVLNNTLSFDKKIIADLCAGTGFYGFEALSRGAEKVYFFEKEFKACKIIDTVAKNFNIDKISFDIIKGDVLKSLKLFAEFHPKTKFDIIFFDPPYNSIILNDIIFLIDKLKILNDDGIFVIESSEFRNTLIGNFDIFIQKKYGLTKITYLKKHKD